MKISCFSDEIAPALKDQIRVIKELGLKYLEIRTVDDISVMDLSDEQLKKIRKTCDENNLSITCVASPIGKDKVDFDKESAVSQTEHACHIADIFGCRFIRIFSFFKQGIEEDRAYELAFEKLKAMAETAEKKDKVLVMEGGHDTVCGHSIVARKMFDEINSPFLKSAFDMAAFFAEGDEPFEESLPNLIPYIEYVHIKDVKRNETGRVPAGEGDARVADIINSLRNHELIMSLEPHLAYAGAKRGFSGEENFKKAHSALIGILDRLSIKYQ